MDRAPTTTAILIACLVPMHTQAQQLTGNDLYETCADVQWCHGFAAGLIAGATWHELSAVINVCLPRGVTAVQLHEALKSWLHAHPADRPQPLDLVVGAAVADGFGREK